MKSPFWLSFLAWFFIDAAASFGLSDADLKFLSQGQWTFDANTDQTVLAVENDYRLIVTASLGTRRVRLLIDTGNPVSHIRQSLIGAHPELFDSTSSAYFPHSHFIKRLRLGAVELQSFVIVDSPPFDKLERTLRVDGTLGMNVLGRLNWEADFVNKTVTIYRDPQPLKDPVEINPLYDLRLVVGGSVDGTRANWMIDTGWGVGFPISGLQLENLPASTVFHHVSGRLAASNFMQDNAKDPVMGVAKNVVIGKSRFATLSFSVNWPRDEYSREFSGLFNTTGIVPFEFFQGGTLYVNGPAGQVAWILPPRTSPPTTSALQLYGFDIEFRDSNRAEVVGIDEDSWAYRAGVRLGDSILVDTFTVNGTADADSEQLRGHPGAMISFDYLRSDEVRHISAPYADELREMLFSP